MIKKDILIGKLRKKLVETLIPLVDNDYVLVDLHIILMWVICLYGRGRSVY